MKDLWHSRVEITQIPSEIEEEDIRINYREYKKIQKTWMQDLLSDFSIYGLELDMNDHFSMIFFKKAHSRKEAAVQAQKLLHFLQFKFPGLAGKASTLHVTRSGFEYFPVLELRLPPPGSSLELTYPILQRLIYLFSKICYPGLKFFIFWQKDDSIESKWSNAPETYFFEIYKVKIFMTQMNTETIVFTENQIFSKYKTILDFLILGLNNISKKPAEISIAPLGFWRNILKFDVFFKNKDFKVTGRQFQLIRHGLSALEMPTFLTPCNVDFTFMKDLPLPRAVKMEQENVCFSNGTLLGECISIGKYLSNGIPTLKEKFIPINTFSQSTAIFGQMGTGKTFLLSQVSKEFHEKAKDIGILYLNLGKGNQEKFYVVDEVIKYGSETLKIPYHVKAHSFHDRKTLQETATYLISSLGLKDPVDKVLFDVMEAYIKVDGELPESLEELFKGLKKWYLKYKYHDEYQTNILRAIENRILAIISDPKIEAILELLEGSKVPKWFRDWRAGKKIYIDLSMCNIYTKRLLSMAIFQMIRTLTPNIEVEKLQNLIVLDEAHQLLEKSVINNPYDDDFIAREQLEKIFKLLLREFRGKGLAFIISDQTPHLLFNCASILPSFKILFRLGFQSSRLFSNKLTEQELIQSLRNRQAIVLNGVNAERYMIETINFTPKNYFLPYINDKKEAFQKSE